MNYDLCDLLNRKLEAHANYLPEKLPSSSIFKNQDLLDKFLDIMYFSGVMKLMYAKNKCMYVECCIRPSLDQLLKLKDLEREVLSEDGVVIWRIYERRGKNQYYQGIGFDSLHSFKWSKIK